VQEVQPCQHLGERAERHVSGVGVPPPPQHCRCRQQTGTAGTRGMDILASKKRATDESYLQYLHVSAQCPVLGWRCGWQRSDVGWGGPVAAGTRGFVAQRGRRSWRWSPTSPARQVRWGLGSPAGKGLGGEVRVTRSRRRHENAQMPAWMGKPGETESGRGSEEALRSQS